MSDATALEMPGLDELVESANLDNGSYDFEIVSVNENDIEWPDKTTGLDRSATVVNVFLIAQNEVNVRGVGHSIFKPNPTEDDAAEDSKRLRQMAGFLKVFNIPMVDTQYSDFIGKVAHLRVTQKNDKNGEPRVNVKIPIF